MRKLRKKGSIQDLLFIAVSLFVLSIVILIGFKVSDTLNDNFQASSDITAEGKTAFNQVNNMYPGVLNSSFLLLLLGLTIVAFIFASMVRIHPVFIALFVLILIIIIILSAAFSNIYQTIAANADMVDVANKLVFISRIMQMLPFIVGIIGSLLAIVMYKTYSEGGNV